jgi:hypothetical protein
VPWNTSTTRNLALKMLGTQAILLLTTVNHIRVGAN